MTSQASTAGPTSAAATDPRGVVSYLNARPLYDCLTDRDDLVLKADVPADLAEMLLNGRCDVALLPIVDYWRHKADLQPVSDACIAGDGETMTVRVFSKRPADKVRRLHVDGDSHTSIILAQIVWRELYKSRLELVPWKPDNPGSLDDVDALLLSGDAGVSEPPGSPKAAAGARLIRSTMVGRSMMFFPTTCVRISPSAVSSPTIPNGASSNALSFSS